MHREIDQHSWHGTSIAPSSAMAETARFRYETLADWIAGLVESGTLSATGRHANCMRLSGGHGWDAKLDRGLRTLGALLSRALAAA